MDALRVIADDLTGACDVGVELLPWPAGIAVQPQPTDAPPAGVPGTALCVRNTQSRTLAPAAAAARVTHALAEARSGWSGIVLKKIDTALRGQLGAEIDAAMDVLGIDEAFVLPAIPEVGRTTEQGRQMIGGVPVDQTAFARDPQNPIHDASVVAAIEATGRRRATSIGLEAVRDKERFASAIASARGAGAPVIVCDAETDADLERSVRVLLGRTRPLLLVGSTGLARALRRVLGTEMGVPVRPPVTQRPTDTGVLVVAGSAHPATRAQVERAKARGVLDVVAVEVGRRPQEAGAAAAQLVGAGRAVVLVSPETPAPEGSETVLAALRGAALTALVKVRPSGLVLIGGETAYHVLEGLGHPALWLESRPAPLVVRSRLVAGPCAGVSLVTKGGSSGAPELLAQIVRTLARGGR